MTEGDRAASDAADVDRPEAEVAAFAFLSLEGDRFKRRGMPASSTREIGFFRNAIYELAREIYLERNPDRRNVPDGFDAAFDLRLTVVLPGSARPQLVLARPPELAEPVWEEWFGIFSDARDGLTRSVRQSRAAEQRQTKPPSVSPRVQSAIQRLGSTLRNDEVAVVGHPSIKQRRVRMDESTRQSLRRPEAVGPTPPTTLDLVGVITEYDGVRQSFDLRTEAGIAKCVLEWFNEDLATVARDVLALDGVTAPDVSVQGETLDVNRKPVHLYNVNSIRIVRGVEEKALASRLAKLSELRDGWWGTASLAPAPIVTSRLDLLIAGLTGLAVAVDLIPQTDGSVSIEVRRGTAELTAVIEPEAGMTLIRDDVETDELEEQTSEFDAGSLLEFLRRGVLNHG